MSDMILYLLFFNILNCFSFILIVFHLNVKFRNFVVCICHFYAIYLFLKCVCHIYKVLSFSFGSVFSCFNTTIDCFCCPHL